MICTHHHPQAIKAPYLVPAWLKPVPLTVTDISALLRRVLAIGEPEAMRWLRGLWKEQGKLITDEQIVSIINSGRVPPGVREAIEESYITSIAETLAGIRGRAADKMGRGIFAGMASGKWTLSERLLATLAMRDDRLAVDMSNEALRTIAYLAEYFTVTAPSPAGIFANAIQSWIGLTEREARALTNMRDKLIEGGASAGTVARQETNYRALLTRGRAQRIARTELSYTTTQAVTEAGREAIEQGLVIGRLVRRWFTGADEVTCPICLDMDGDIAELDGPFKDGSDGPPVHPNCRCVPELVQLVPELT